MFRNVSKEMKNNKPQTSTLIDSFKKFKRGQWSTNFSLALSNCQKTIATKKEKWHQIKRNKTLLILLAAIVLLSVFIYAFSKNTLFLKTTNKNKMPSEVFYELPDYNSTPTQEYFDSFSDTQAQLKLSFNGKMYVKRMAEKKLDDGVTHHGTILIGFSKELNRSSLKIDYGIPSLGFSSIICIDSNSKPVNLTFKMSNIKTVFSCIIQSDNSSSIAKSKNDHKQKIEYRFSVSGSVEDRREYQQIIKKGLSLL